MRLELQERETLDLSPHTLLADKDEEHEKASQHIAAINNSEEEPKGFETMTWGLIIVVVEEEVESFYGPEDTKG